jgi:N6-adenosine-specific RNA methylase IME4
MKKYSVIYADPPWKYRNTNPPCLPSKSPGTCSVEYYYPPMAYEDISAMPIKDITEKDSILFLWSTTPNIEQGLSLVKDWGYKYKTMITWDKLNKDCMGYWFRVCTEHLIVAVKGNIKSFRSMERTCYREARRRHSQKPDYFYSLIESVTTGKKLELFARNKRDGWDVFGNEVADAIHLWVK